MKIITLVDNRTQSESLETEHGLSLYIETDDNLKILYDTGQSDLFIHNANKLGVDLSAIDRVVISHGHYDHIG
ncbi:MAG TPA: MBL fold metallo-hydrolase, partial [Brumimicrobium sp.]|nr:MBL fold metallo-hydrolase [Brumimicrobium sp.]